VFFFFELQRNVLFTLIKGKIENRQLF